MLFFNMYRFFFFLMTSLLTLNLYLISPAEAALISTRQEIGMGRQLADQVEKQYKVTDNSELQQRVDRIGKRLAAVSERPDLPYTFKVLDHDEVNAFALPGGFIYIFRGLTDYMQTDDELAGIIGHEIGHAVKRHSMAQLEKTLGTAVLFGFAFGSKGLEAQLIALNAVTAGYSRDDERTADRLGFEETMKAGYNPYSMLVGLMKLEKLHPDYQTDLFSDHPDTEQRIQLVKNYMKKTGIHPAAWEKDGAAFVGDKEAVLPPVRGEEEGLTSLMRASFIAGRLYPLTKLSGYDRDHYIMDRDGKGISLYYEDQYLLTISEQDAALAGMEQTALADACLRGLENWTIQSLPESGAGR